MTAFPAAFRRRLPAAQLAYPDGQHAGRRMVAPVPVKRVYLDQKDWITLARVHHGKDTDPVLKDVLLLVRESVERSLASFPLSAAHYEETFRHGDPQRRKRLGAFMAEVSRFHTISGAPDVLESEVRQGLHQLLGMPPAPQPVVFGVGVAHAFGQPSWSYLSDEEVERRAIAMLGREAVFEHFETVLLTGPSERLPFAGIQLPPLRQRPAFAVGLQ